MSEHTETDRRISVPRLPRALLDHGVEAGYDACWRAALSGEIAAEQDKESRRWTVRESDLPRIAQIMDARMRRPPGARASLPNDIQRIVDKAVAAALEAAGSIPPPPGKTPPGRFPPSPLAPQPPVEKLVPVPPSTRTRVPPPPSHQPKPGKPPTKRGRAQESGDAARNRAASSVATSPQQPHR